MSSTKTWLPLPVPSSPSLPRLLVSVEIGTATYTIHVTDMANMWCESLDRKAICIRGWSENTSIDSSDTPENMGKFLSSIRSALDSSEPNHEDTSLQLLRGTNSEAGDDGLALKVTCQLPGLQPLKWPFYLKKSPPSAIATDLVLPLIQAHQTRSQEVESLIQALNQKDSALTRVVDKLEALGAGLEQIFHVLSSKRKCTREEAQMKVPGLVKFDRRKWKSELAEKEDDPSNIQDLLDDVFGKGGLQYESIIDVSPSPGLDKWWHDFTGVSSSAGTAHRKEVPKREATPTPQEQSFGQDDDDFQVQSTPPHLKSKLQPRVSKQTAVPDDASTDDGSDSLDLEVASRSISKSRKEPQAKNPISRLGTLGRKKQSTPPRSPSPKVISPRKQVADAVDDDTETASETDEDGATVSPPPKEAPTLCKSPSPKPALKKGGLGRIGGPKPVRSRGDSVQPEEAEKMDRLAAMKKLGIIGKKKSPELLEKEIDVGSNRGRAGEQYGVGIASKTRETSQERADRKREELKRELEQKAAAGPAKKKRKF